jgi:putative OPT family oligopeptide transporter
VGSPGISPAYFGVGYIIGPRLGALNFSGTLIAWGMLIPMFLFLLGPTLNVDGLAAQLIAGNPDMTMDSAVRSVWTDYAYHIWKFIVRPIAIGGMLVSSVYTLYKMRKNLFAGLARSFKDIRISPVESQVPSHDRDMNIRWIALIGFLGAISIFILTYFVFQSGLIIAIVASTIMIALSFFLSAIAGYIVGIIGSSNNPVSGLTLTALVITALIVLLLGATGIKGIAVVLAIAAVVCIGAAVAGEMLQDLKVGYILKGTPSKMQFSDLIGVVISGSVLFIVLAMLNQGDIAKGLNDGYVGGFGSKNLPAPQANMIALLAKGIIQGNMSWVVIIAGMLMGLGFIAMQVKSPMLVFIGMYLPIETTFAIFIGGLVKGFTDWLVKRATSDDQSFARAENVGVLLASGLIAGEALMGLVIAFLAVGNIFMYKWFAFFQQPSSLISLLVLAFISLVVIYLPYKNRN